MNLWETVKNNLALKALSLCLALLLWIFVSSGRESEISLAVPVRISNLPPGLAVAAAPPSTVSVMLKGPVIQLWKCRAARPVIILDLKDVAEGTTAFPNMAGLIGLPEGVMATRVSPASTNVTLIRSGARGTK